MYLIIGILSIVFLIAITIKLIFRFLKNSLKDNFVFRIKAFGIDYELKTFRENKDLTTQ